MISDTQIATGTPREILSLRSQVTTLQCRVAVLERMVKVARENESRLREELRRMADGVNVSLYGRTFP